MTLLDEVAEFVDYLMSALPSPAAAVLSVPVFLLAVFLGSLLFVRRALAPLARAFTMVVGWVVVGIGAAVLLPEAAIATGYRGAERRPPEVVYRVGDAVASGVVSAGRGLRRLSERSTRLAGLPGLLVLLVVVVWLWWWNGAHCPPGAAKACVGPITTWWTYVTS